MIKIIPAESTELIFRLLFNDSENPSGWSWGETVGSLLVEIDDQVPDKGVVDVI